MRNPTFYNLTDPAPAALPPFLVIADRGTWAAPTQDDAFELSSKLGSCGISTKVVKGVWA